MEASLPIVFSFSGGKDSCLSIYRLKKQNFKKDCLNEIYEKLMEFKAIVVCVDLRVLDISFLSRKIDKNFIKDLPN